MRKDSWTVKVLEYGGLDTHYLEELDVFEFIWYMMRAGWRAFWIGVLYTGPVVAHYFAFQMIQIIRGEIPEPGQGWVFIYVLSFISCAIADLAFLISGEASNWLYRRRRDWKNLKYKEWYRNSMFTFKIK